MRFAILLLLWATPVLGELGSIRIEGRATATTTKVRITLADVADVYSPNGADDDAIVALRAIKLGTSPQPGRFLELSADEVLNALRAAQVNLNQVGYKLPKSIVVTRASRAVGEPELRAAIEGAFAKQGREVLVRAVDVADPFLVEPGPISLEASFMNETNRNRAALLVTAKGATTEARTKVMAAIEEWREVAVAARSLGRGTVVTPSDVVMARLQTTSIPLDASSRATAPVGLAVQTGIAAGEPFSTQKLVVPPVVNAGSKVTMLVKFNGIEATATGIAVDSGAVDQRISIRNEASKKIVTGKIIEPGLVLVEEKIK